MRFVIIYTKTCHILLMQSMNNMKVPPQLLGAAVARTKRGIPRIIPRLQREALRKGDSMLLRIWLSWFSIYRVLESKPTLKLSTITDQGPANLSLIITEMSQLIPAFARTFLKIGEGELLARLGPISYLRLTKASPVAVGLKKNSVIAGLLYKKGSIRSSSPLGIVLSAAYITRSSI